MRMGKLPRKKNLHLPLFIGFQYTRCDHFLHLFFKCENEIDDDQGLMEGRCQ